MPHSDRTEAANLGALMVGFIVSYADLKKVGRIVSRKYGFVRLTKLLFLKLTRRRRPRNFML